MTEQRKQEITEILRSLFIKNISLEMADFIQERVGAYNRLAMEGEEEMTFEEMAELLNEKLTTYRGKQ